MQDDRAQKLHDFLEESCNVAEMRSLVRRLPGGLEPHLTEGSVRPAEFAWELVQLLTRHNAIDAEFFRGLLAFRPKRGAEIVAVAAGYDIAVTTEAASLRPIEMLGDEAVSLAASAVLAPAAPLPPKVDASQHDFSGYQRRVALLGALGVFVVVPGVVVSALTLPEPAESTADSRRLLERDAPAPVETMAFTTSPEPATDADAGGSTTPEDSTRSSESNRGSVQDATSVPATTGVRPESGSAARPPVKRLEHEACASLKKRTRAALSTCASSEALAAKETAVDITVSSGGEDVEVVPRSGHAYPDYLRCVENAIKLATRDLQLERAKRYKCELALK